MCVLLFFCCGCCFEAIDRLNIKPCNMRDLLTDEKFSRSDLITLQDPSHPEKWDVSTFHYVKQGQTEGIRKTCSRFGNTSVQYYIKESSKQEHHQMYVT